MRNTLLSAVIAMTVDGAERATAGDVATFVPLDIQSDGDGRAVTIQP